jgi:hypothetical protein
VCVCVWEGLLGVGLHKYYRVWVCVCVCECLLSHVAPQSVDTRFITYHSGVAVLLEWRLSSVTVYVCYSLILVL